MGIVRGVMLVDHLGEEKGRSRSVKRSLAMILHPHRLFSFSHAQTIEFYFDFFSPFGYLGSIGIEEIAQAYGCVVES